MTTKFLIRKLVSWAKETDGQFGVYGALLGLPIIIAVGASVDFTEITREKTELRNALDAAATYISGESYQ